MAGGSSSPADPLHWWNPRKLLLQIVLLQSAYTLTEFVFVTFLVLVMGAPFRIDYIFLPSRFMTNNVFGWTLSFLSILTSVLTVLYIVLIVRRSQLVLDFALTLQGFNLLFILLYNWRIPITLGWWVTKIIETNVMIFGGKYFCRMRELRPIEFNMYEMVPTNPVEPRALEEQLPNGTDDEHAKEDGKALKASKE